MKIQNILNYELEALSIIYLKLYKKNNLIDEILNSVDKNDESFVKFQNYKKFVDSIDIELTNGITKLKPYFQNFIYQGPFLIHFHIFYSTSKEKDFKTILNKYFSNFYNDFLDEDTNINDIKSFINSVNKLDIQDDIKMHMINFYIDGEKIYNEVIDYSKSIIINIKNSIGLINDDLKNLFNKLKTSDQISLEHNYQLEFFKEPDLEVITCAVLSNQATLFKENDVTYAFVGYLLFDIIEAKERNLIDETKIMEFLKLISDQTRMRILTLLKEKHMFVQELSKELKLTTPTLIHHVELLLNANLIDVYMNKDDKKRVFYKLNENKIRELLDMLGRNLL